MSKHSVISVKNVTFAYPQSAEQMVLSINDWSVERGDHVFLYGPSGSGKSTLLNLLTGLTEPTSGQISILNQDLAKLKGKGRDIFRARHIGFVFQQFNLVPYLSVKDNILLADYFSENKKADKTSNKPDTINSRIKDLITKLQLPESILEQPASQLSVGQQQRVAIARALINEPELLIADEPTSSLDQDSRDAFIKLLFSLTESYNATLVFVSHDKSLASQFGNVLDIQSINQAGRHFNDVC